VGLTTGQIERFMTSLNGKEMSGLTWSGDKCAMFVGIQHPAALFPVEEGKLPRSTGIIVKRDDNAIIGEAELQPPSANN
jgi:uncharacterized protein